MQTQQVSKETNREKSVTSWICKKIEITKSKNEIFVPVDNCHKGRWEKYFGSSHILRDFLVPPTSTMMLETKWWPIYTDCWQFPEFCAISKKTMVFSYIVLQFSVFFILTTVRPSNVLQYFCQFWALESLRKLEFLFHDKLQFIFDHDDGKGCV